MFMPHYSMNEILLVRYPFSDLSAAKVRPAVVVNAPHPSQDSFIVPLTSRLHDLMPGEFALQEWEEAGLNVPTAAKRGIYTIHPDLVVKRVGQLSTRDGIALQASLRGWLGL
jgi:mRNA interferase MazF